MSDFQKRNSARPGDRDTSPGSLNGRSPGSFANAILDIFNKFAHFKYGVEIDGQLTVNDVTYLAQLLTAAAGIIVSGGIYTDNTSITGTLFFGTGPIDAPADKDFKIYRDGTTGKLHIEQWNEGTGTWVIEGKWGRD